jgi:hypothetical protein
MYIHSHTISNHACIQTHTHSSRHTATLYIYNLRTLKKTSSVLYSSYFFFWVSIQPLLGHGWNFFFVVIVLCSAIYPSIGSCYQCNLHISLVLHTNSNSTNHMKKSSHILVSALVKGRRKFFFISETTLDFILYITIFILWTVNESHAQKNFDIFSHFFKKHFGFLLLKIFKIFLAFKKTPSFH